MRRRLHFVPFTVTIPPAERDPELPEKLKAEGAAILRWMIDGCLEWQRQGLNPPEIVRAATAEYLTSEDAFERWRDECTEADPHAWASSGDLWNSWKRWAEHTGEFVGKQRKFSGKPRPARALPPSDNPARGHVATAACDCSGRTTPATPVVTLTEPAAPVTHVTHFPLWTVFARPRAPARIRALERRCATCVTPRKVVSQGPDRRLLRDGQT